MDYDEFIAMQNKILSCTTFDDVAPVAIYIYADSKYKDEAKKGIASLKRKCNHIPQVKELKPKDIINDGTDDLGFDGLYNKAFESVLSDYRLETETYVDKWGAYCYRDKMGHSHCGDDSGFYPYHLTEKSLRKRIENLEV